MSDEFDDWSAWADERAEAEYLRRSEIEWAHENPPEIGGES